MRKRTVVLNGRAVAGNSRFRNFWLMVLVGAAFGVTAGADELVSARGLAGDGTVPCAEAIQRLIDANPNREIFFPDGTYLLDRPICTPAHPKLSVALKLSNYAVFKAAPGWTNAEAMVRLGAIHPANDIRTPGSWYWLKGGIVDGSGVADGVSIDGGRETLVADVSMKAVRVGLRIKRGANSGSSDCDIRNVNIVGNGAADSIGVLVDGYDNTIEHMRIANVVKGVVVNSGGNCLRDLHPLFTGGWQFYDRSVGFEINGGNCWGDFCYSDQFATGFRFGKGGNGVFDKSFCFWYKSGKGMKHVGFESVGAFNVQLQSPTVCFKSAEANNALVIEGQKGGCGFIRDARCDLSKVKDPARRALVK